MSLDWPNGTATGGVGGRMPWYNTGGNAPKPNMGGNPNNVVPYAPGKAPAQPAGPPSPGTPQYNQQQSDHYYNQYKPWYDYVSSTPDVMSQMQQLQASMNNGYSGIGQALANQQYQTNLYQQQYGQGLQGIGLQRQGLGYDNQLLGIQGRGLDIDMSAAQRQPGLQTALLDLARQEYGQNVGGIEQDAATQRRKAANEFVSRGAWFSPEYGAVRGDINATEARQKEMAKLGFTGTELQANERIASANDSIGKIGLDKERLGVDRQKLALTAKQYNLDENSLYQNLQSQISRLGLDTYVNINDILQGLYSTDIQRSQLSQSILQQAIELGGSMPGVQPPGQYPPQYPSQYPSSPAQP